MFALRPVGVFGLTTTFSSADTPFNFQFQDLIADGANADYAWQFSLRVFGWRKSPAAWLSFWSLGIIARMSKTFIIILAAIAVVVLAVGVPNFIRARQTSASNVYVNDLRQIDAAKQQWALENSKTTNDAPTWSELLPYISPGFTNFYTSNGVVVRPAGGVFTIGRVGESPSCVVDGKRVDYP